MEQALYDSCRHAVELEEAELRAEYEFAGEADAREAGPLTADSAEQIGPLPSEGLPASVLPTAVAYWKYRALGSVAMGASATLLLLIDGAWPFRVAALFQVLCALDELRTTWLFAECRHDFSLS